MLKGQMTAGEGDVKLNLKLKQVLRGTLEMFFGKLQVLNAFSLEVDLTVILPS